MTYATPLLALGVVGLAVTCFAANGSVVALATAKAAPAPAPVEAAPPPAPVEAVSLPVTQPEPVEAVPAAAVVNPVDEAARTETCQGELNKIVSANPVDFLRDRIELTANSKASARELAVVIRACPGMKVEIQGHTDKTGKRQANIRLSKKRADAVKNYLVELGLSPDLMTAVGFGPDRPVASNRTVAGRAKNRRIEFRVSREE